MDWSALTWLLLQSAWTHFRAYVVDPVTLFAIEHPLGFCFAVAGVFMGLLQYVAVLETREQIRELQTTMDAMIHVEGKQAQLLVTMANEMKISCEHQSRMQAGQDAFLQRMRQLPAAVATTAAVRRSVAGAAPVVPPNS